MALLVCGAMLALSPSPGAGQGRDAIDLRCSARPDILVDGRFSPGEWGDALRLPLGQTDTLMLVADRHFLWLAVVPGTRKTPYVDVFIQDSTGTIVNLHASMQTGERVLPAGPWDDRSPPTQWGNESGWIGSLTKWRVLDSGQPTNEWYPVDGRELQLRRAKLPGQSWRIRVESRDLGGVAPDQIFPADSRREAPQTWAQLRLPVCA